MGCALSRDEEHQKQQQQQQQEDSEALLDPDNSQDPQVRRFTALLHRCNTRVALLSTLPEILLDGSSLHPDDQADLVRVLAEKMRAVCAGAGAGAGSGSAAVITGRLFIDAQTTIDQVPVAEALTLLYPFVKEVDLSGAKYISKACWIALMKGLKNELCQVEKMRFQMHPQLFFGGDQKHNNNHNQNNNERHDANLLLEATNIFHDFLRQSPRLRELLVRGSKNPEWDQHTFQLLSKLEFSETLERIMLYEFQLPNGDALSQFLFHQGPRRPKEVSLSSISLESAWKKPANLENVSSIQSVAIHELQDGNGTQESRQNSRNSSSSGSGNSGGSRRRGSEFLAEVGNMPHLKEVVLGQGAFDNNDPRQIRSFFKNVLRNNTVHTVSARNLPIQLMVDADHEDNNNNNNKDDTASVSSDGAETIRSLAATNTALTRVTFGLDGAGGTSNYGGSRQQQANTTSCKDNDDLLKILSHCAALNRLGRGVAADPNTTLSEFVNQVLIKTVIDVRRRQQRPQLGKGTLRHNGHHQNDYDNGKGDTFDLLSLIFDFLLTRPALWSSSRTTV